MDSLSSFAALEGASSSFLSALKAWANNEPNSTENLYLAAEGLATGRSFQFYQQRLRYAGGGTSSVSHPAVEYKALIATDKMIYDGSD